MGVTNSIPGHGTREGSSCRGGAKENAMALKELKSDGHYSCFFLLYLVLMIFDVGSAGICMVWDGSLISTNIYNS